jgi:hypothetical protein
MISVVKSVIAGDVRGAGADAAGQSYQNITWIGELTAGDVIYILVTQTSGGNLDIQSADSYFSITRLG